MVRDRPALSLAAVCVAAAAVCLALLAAPAAAQQELFNDFKNDGRVDTCAYSPEQLRRGLQNLPPDLEQYAPGFGDQLRNRSGCGGPAQGAAREETSGGAAAGGRGGGSGPPSTGSGSTEVPRPPAPRVAVPRPLTDGAPPALAAAADDRFPAWLAALMAALAAGTLAAVLALRSGRLGGAPGLRIALVDAGGRIADGAAQAWDRVRFGR